MRLASKHGCGMAENSKQHLLATLRLQTPAAAAAASCPLTEDVPLIESLEASKLLATEIGEKVAEAAETEIAINDSRNKYRPVAERGAMLFFLLNSLNKIHAFYQYRWVLRLACIRGWAAAPRAHAAHHLFVCLSRVCCCMRSLNAFVVVFARGLDLAPGGRKKQEEHVTLRELQKRVSGNAQGYEQVIRKAKRQSSTCSSRGPVTPGSAAPSTPSSKRGSQTHGGPAGRGAVACLLVAFPQRPPPSPAAVQQSLTKLSCFCTLLPAGTLSAEATEEAEVLTMTPEQLEVRIAALLNTCTYTVFNYTRRGMFDRDKLIVLTLLTFQILLRSGSIDATEYDALCKGARSAAPPPITDDLSRCARPAVYLSPLLSAPSLHVCRAMLRQPASLTCHCLMLLQVDE